MGAFDEGAFSTSAFSDEAFAMNGETPAPSPLNIEARRRRRRVVVA